MAVDIEKAKVFLGLLDPSAEKFCFQVIGEGKQKGNKALGIHHTDTLDNFGYDLSAYNDRGAGVFVTVNETDLHGRKIENIKRIRAVWCDYDSKAKGYKTLDELLGSFPLEPSMVVITSVDSYHFYWLVDGAWGRHKIDDGIFSAVMQSIVDNYGGDNNTKDVSRVLRVPGFCHMKGEPSLVTLIKSNGNRYTKQDIFKAFVAKRAFRVMPPPIVNHKLQNAVVNVSRYKEKDGMDWQKNKERVRSAIQAVSAKDRYTWRHEVGAPMHYASGGSEDAFEMYHDWSRDKGGDKYKGEEDIREIWEGFKVDHSNPKTLASLFKLAKDNGWDEDYELYKTTLVPGEIAMAKPLKGGTLASKTIEKLTAAFNKWGHKPSMAQYMGLIDLANHLEGMANGDLTPLYYLSCLDPGVGKTQTIVHFTKELLSSSTHNHVGVVICVGRIAEIDSLVKQMKLRKNDFACLVSANETDKNKKKRNDRINGLGNPDKEKARVLFITQQMLEARSKRLDSFTRIDEFKFCGQPRQVRVWDETCLPARPLRVSIGLIEGMTDTAKANTKLHRAINKLIEDIKGADDKTLIDVPDFEDVTRVDLGFALAMYDEDKKAVRQAVNDLWLMSGKTVTLRQEGNYNTILDYENTLPDDLKPVVICDASGRVRQTYPHWSKGRGDLVTLQHGTKDYSNLTVRVWLRAGSKTGWENDKATLTDGIVNTILTKPQEKWLIVHHLKTKKFKVDVPQLIIERLELLGHKTDNLSFIHWGGDDYRATNQYRDIGNVILAGVMFYETTYYEAVGKLSRGLKSNQFLSREQYKQIEAGEHAHLILQSLCRASVRKSKDNGCGVCEAYVIDAPHYGLKDMLEKGYLFPNCKVEPWVAVAKELKGRTKKAFEFIVNWFNHNHGKLKTSYVCNQLKIDTDDFRKEVVNHRDFEAVLSEHSIKIDRKIGRGGTDFVRALPLDSPF